ncbi:MAG: TetR/AcrR family transcriptional regulator, partial [Anaerovoracaceae bacterium]
MTPRKKQSMETKQKIFDTAIQLFSSEPFEQVTINRICKDAGVTTGAFYHHFQSKEEILMIQYDNVDQTFSSLLEDLSCETYVEKLCEYIGYYAQSAKNDGPATVTEV